ncbi:MAG: PAS domain-containing protein, partial [Candidatus Omnitrophica bacterium]|nr:PAS domain-containing protein [Candidatus Omnitrophota bacterium]
MRRVSRSSANRYKDLYQVLLNAIPSSVLLISRSFRIVSANRNFLEKSKRSEADTLNRKLPEVFPPPLLDNLDLVRRIQMAFQQNQQTLGERMIYRAPGGLMRIYYYRVLPLAWNGSVDRVMLLMDDVTEQTRLSEDIRRTERHLAIVVESASEFLLSTDPDGRILSWNKSAEQVSGYALQEVHRHKFSQLCIPEHQADVDRVF